ncbi:hypothetical protein RSOLAG1IB_09298 [Rhizoctonia solani AG-1 IB]|uniref:Uncharacterized protein n=1 Tax=Thanatephorus cucumeris (strain AG1-IB / isolate 7/3/14) TaxID=1108050 RepID=A0A0B7FQU6_THACB|nr:hypothetical protein RSOLAG1IB_09298 [Rhizoctonia solani AG-1 IB]
MPRIWGNAKRLAQSIGRLIVREGAERLDLRPYFDIGYRAGGVRGGAVMVFQGLVLWTGTEIASYNLGRENKYVPVQQQQHANLALKFITWSRVRGASYIASRGDGKTDDSCCWEHVIGAKNAKKLDQTKKELYQQNGMLLQDVAEFCEPYKVGDSEIFVLQNEDKIAFAFAIVEEYPAGSSTEYPNDKCEVAVVHPVPIHLIK